MYYKSKDSWKRLHREKICYSFSILILFPCSSSPSCPHSRTENKPCKPLNTPTFFYFFKKKRYQNQIHDFQFCGKKSDSFCHLVPNQNLGTTSISHPGGAMSWQQQFTSLRTRKSTQNRCSLTSTCTAQATGTTRAMLAQSRQTQQQVTGKKALTESWRSKANKSTDENCPHAVPGAEVYTAKKRLQSARKARKK